MGAESIIGMDMRPNFQTVIAVEDQFIAVANLNSGIAFYQFNDNQT